MDTTDTIPRKELLWLACREKSCCHDTKVIIGGRDIWRIAQALEIMPWQFTLYTEALEGAPDGFGLEPDGPHYQVILAKQREAGPRGTPCIFLWKLADGHAQCGLGALRPLPCLTFPSVVSDGLLRVESTTCSCRRWTLNDVDPAREESLLGQMLEEAAEYSEVVARWNAGLQTGSAGRTYREFCEYVLTEYRRRYGSPLPESGSDA
jgi:Fe-S-cluster containining protein